MSDDRDRHVLLYCKLGCPCLLIRPPSGAGTGKQPLASGWQDQATTDPVTLLRALFDHPFVGLGILTGQRSRIAVLDIDPRHGGNESLKELELTYGRLPDTPIVHTGGGGEHYYFRSDVALRSRTGLRPGVDFKAEGGFVVAPPSLHASGHRYEWDGVLNLETVALAPVPRWLLTNATSEKPPALAGSKAQVSSLTFALLKGQRNVVLTSVAGHLLRRYVEPQLALDLLHAANATYGRPPLPVDEIERIAESVARMERNRRGVKRHG